MYRLRARKDIRKDHRPLLAKTLNIINWKSKGKGVCRSSSRINKRSLRLMTSDVCSALTHSPWDSQEGNKVWKSPKLSQDCQFKLPYFNFPPIVVLPIASSISYNTNTLYFVSKNRGKPFPFKNFQFCCLLASLLLIYNWRILFNSL